MAWEQPCSPVPGHPRLIRCPQVPCGKGSSQQTPLCEQGGSQRGKRSDFFPLFSHLWHHNWGAGSALGAPHHEKDTSPAGGALRRVVKGLYCPWSPIPQGSVMGAVLLNIWRRQGSAWSSSLQMRPNRGDRSMHSQAGLLSRATKTDWRDGPSGTLWNSAKANAKCCTTEGKKPLWEYWLGAEWWGSSSAEKGLGVLVDSRLDMKQQCGLAAKKAHSIISCIRSSIGIRWREVIIGLDLVLVRPSPGYCVQSWASCYMKGMDKLKEVQWRAAGVARSWNMCPVSGKGEQALFCLRRRGLWGHCSHSYEEVMKKMGFSWAQWCMAG